MTSESIDPDDIDSLDGLRDELDRDRDGVGALRDTEAEAGDEEEITDSFDLDVDEARELGANLDRVDGETPELD